MTTTNEPSADARNRLILQLQDVNFRNDLAVSPTPVREYVREVVNQLRCAHVDLAAAADTILWNYRDSRRLEWLLTWLLRNGKRSEVMPRGHVAFYTPNEVRNVIDDNIARETQALLDAGL